MCHDDLKVHRDRLGRRQFDSPSATERQTGEDGLVFPSLLADESNRVTRLIQDSDWADRAVIDAYAAEITELDNHVARSLDIDVNAATMEAMLVATVDALHYTFPFLGTGTEWAWDDVVVQLERRGKVLTEIRINGLHAQLGYLASINLLALAGRAARPPT